MNHKKTMAIALLSMFLVTMQFASATMVYNSDNDITSSVGGTRYWASSLNVGDGLQQPLTRVLHKQDSPGTNYYRPGSTSPESISAISTTPTGRGWATNFNIPGDIPAGTWTFNAITRNSRSGATGFLGVNVFSYCNGTNTRLFYIESTNNAMGTTAETPTTITTTQPAFSTTNCRIKFEYWLNATMVPEDNSNEMRSIDTAQFNVDFPTPSGSICVPTPETCNGLDDDCDGQIDESVTNSQSCGVGSCQRTIAQTCTLGTFAPACVPGNPITEICGNGLDDDCDGTVDNGCGTIPPTPPPTPPPSSGPCTPGATQSCGIGIGACSLGTQTCDSNSVWGSCIGAGTPIIETCNGIDDDCDGVTDNNLLQTATCGIGACYRTVLQACNSSQWTPACQPGNPTPETCNDIDDDCDGTIDNGVTKFCGINVGECHYGNQSCTLGIWGTCIGDAKPSKEVCDFKDNDCNGKIDEGNVCLGQSAPPCVEKWSCSDWSSCTNTILSSRNCTDSNQCGTEKDKPTTSKSCVNTEGKKKSSAVEDAVVFVNDNIVFSAALVILILSLLAAAYWFSKDKKKPSESPNENN